MSEDKLVIYTVVVRVPVDQEIGWSVYAVDTKGGYFDGVVESSAFEIPIVLSPAPERVGGE